MADHPPRWPTKILRWFCTDSYIDELEGDLMELYYQDLENKDQNTARWNYFWGIMLSFRWYRFKFPLKINTTLMFKHNILMAFRHGIKNPSFSSINLLGLAFGIGAFIYIALYIQQENGYDKFHQHKDDIYRVILKNGNHRWRPTQTVIGESIHGQFPEMGICRTGHDPVKIGKEDPVLLQEFYWSDSNFFNIFSFPLIEGNPDKVLSEPNSLVITESVARQISPDEPVFGKIIDIKIYDSDKVLSMKVTGIAEDPPANSTIRFQGLGSMANAENMYPFVRESWGFFWLTTYIFAPDYPPNFITDLMPSRMKRFFESKGRDNLELELQPLPDIYLHSDSIANGETAGSIENLYIIGTIGLLIFIITLFNYINLHTARIFIRMKELNVRHTLGSGKFAILGQYIMEAITYLIFGAIMALTLLVVALPFMNHSFDQSLSLLNFGWREWGIGILILFVSGLLAGMTSGVKIIKAMVSGQGLALADFKEGKGYGRRFLMGIQYVITIFLTATAILVYMQFNYLSDYQLGFQSDQLVYISVDDRELQSRIGAMRDQFASVPGVTGTAVSGEKLPSDMNNRASWSWSGKNDDENAGIDIVGVDRNYFKLAGIELLEGTDFTGDYKSDSAGTVILNEEAKKIMGDSAVIGNTITIDGMNREVRGIIRNHHYRSLHSGVGPVAYLLIAPGFRESPDNIFLRIETHDLERLRNNVASIWQQFSPDPLEMEFVNDEFEQAYLKEKRLVVLTGTLTGIAIVIAFMGLLGLITFTIRRKIKELCIRKVLGASLWHLSKLLSIDFLIIFSISILLATPLVYWTGRIWLEDYPYHINVSVWIIVDAVAICLVTSLLVVGTKVAGLSITNPSRELKSE